MNVDESTALPGGHRGLWISPATGGGRTVLRLAGELDMATAGQLTDCVGDVLTTGCRRVVLDVATLAFVDVLGLHALLDAQRRLTAAGGRLTITAVSPALRRLISLAAVEDLLTVDAGRVP